MSKPYRNAQTVMWVRSGVPVVGVRISKGHNFICTYPGLDYTFPMSEGGLLEAKATITSSFPVPALSEVVGDATTFFFECGTIPGRRCIATKNEGKWEWFVLGEEDYPINTSTLEMIESDFLRDISTVEPLYAKN